MDDRVIEQIRVSAEETDLHERTGDEALGVGMEQKHGRALEVFAIGSGATRRSRPFTKSGVWARVSARSEAWGPKRMKLFGILERETRLELATSTLARLRSTN